MLDYMLTLDEAILPNDHANGQTDHYYAKKKVSERGRPAPIATSQQQFPEQCIMCGGFSTRAPTRLFIIPQKTKVNAEYFIKHVLTPMFDIDVKKYGGEAGKVFFTGMQF